MVPRKCHGCEQICTQCFTIDNTNMENDVSVNKNGNLRVDGISVSLPTFLGRLGDTSDWNPGAPGAPSLTVTRSWGLPGFGAHLVHLRPRASSRDTLGQGVSGNVSVGLPSVIVNGAAPDGWLSPGRCGKPAWSMGPVHPTSLRLSRRPTRPRKSPTASIPTYFHPQRGRATSSHRSRDFPGEALQSWRQMGNLRCRICLRGWAWRRGLVHQFPGGPQASGLLGMIQDDMRNTFAGDQSR
ncbi:hypothetical protein ACVILH_003342 [Bradyrhizobium sp. USDA 4353]